MRSVFFQRADCKDDCRAVSIEFIQPRVAEFCKLEDSLALGVQRRNEIVGRVQIAHCPGSVDELPKRRIPILIPLEFFDQGFSHPTQLGDSPLLAEGLNQNVRSMFQKPKISQQISARNEHARRVITRFRARKEVRCQSDLPGIANYGHDHTLRPLAGCCLPESFAQGADQVKHEPSDQGIQKSVAGNRKTHEGLKPGAPTLPVLPEPVTGGFDLKPAEGLLAPGFMVRLESFIEGDKAAGVSIVELAYQADEKGAQLEFLNSLLPVFTSRPAFRKIFAHDSLEAGDKLIYLLRPKAKGILPADALQFLIHSLDFLLRIHPRLQRNLWEDQRTSHGDQHLV